AVDAGVDCVHLIRSAAGHIKGGGGGRPDMAQAGGKDSSGLAAALNTARDNLKATLK
ncbi:MAG: hypothetical protein KDK30_00165, partial [Leptospiraceae bacterium]|nr:hypothetical protein [Leptospiraceae bacterium]